MIAERTNRILRLQQGRLTETEDHIAEEAMVALVYNGISHVVLMATPQDLPELALGFSLSEGILQTPAQLYGIEIQESCNGFSVHMEIAAARFTALKTRRRNMSGRTGCGLCGIDSLAAAMPDIRVVGRGSVIEASHIEQALGQLDDRQPLRGLTGATHSAAWVENGRIVCLFEDVGRHNALDKLIGHLMKSQYDLSEGFVIVSSRASYEMVAKTAACGIGCLVAVSAPTALAIDLAEKANLTLIGFARPDRQTVYTHEHYIRTQINQD
ncbi:MAG: formate dehydrogenase accessory sulfurtransferase FdhD [Neisseria sp.]|uniref:formate dehydrogenase accessory sulfurtransferase FdhD n=1 Tax=Neisseria sp. TaxID=192066 RepID=UPI0026DC81C8|nr:formate dehydrogenase accessory sulfurtransferase FdhD [Neisseria sp.]MDO4641570.1 formate dehydrogenase accessory sulfurtransferase FdhD [Neisseria sp.]